MLEEKLLKKIKTINENFINLGFDLEEDLIELVTQREDIKDRIENTKYKKIKQYKNAVSPPLANGNKKPLGAWNMK